MARRQRAGKNARASWGTGGAAKNLRIKQWSSDHKADDIDTTNMEDQGFDTGLIGPEVNDWSFSGDWDASQNPMDDPPGIYPRDDGGPLLLYTNQTDGINVTMSSVRVLSARITAPVRSSVTFEASGKSQGSFIDPVGSFAA